MNIMSMLVRLQGTLGCTDLVSQMVLLPHHIDRSKATQFTQAEGNSEINLVVGYNSSPGSQTALDLTLWIAHQTRLATGKQVTVQVVYVVDKAPEASTNQSWGKRAAIASYQKASERSLETANSGRSKHAQRTSTALADLNPTPEPTGVGLAEQFEQADRILWQARCLADEWRGSLKTHLRFGNVAEELRYVAQVESAALLLLGCTSRESPVVQAIGTTFPCPVLGIPAELGEG